MKSIARFKWVIVEMQEYFSSCGTDQTSFSMTFFLLQFCIIIKPELKQTLYSNKQTYQNVTLRVEDKIKRELSLRTQTELLHSSSKIHYVDWQRMKGSCGRNEETSFLYNKYAVVISDRKWWCTYLKVQLRKSFAMQNWHRLASSPINITGKF